MMQLKDLIVAVSSIMSVSGYVNRSVGEVETLLGECFDECRKDAVGNICLIKRSKRPLADGEKRPVILVDTHFDEIGMIVTDIKENGFLSVSNIGGLDTGILQASDVCVYGKKKIFGVIASTPPHLSTEEDRKKLKEIGELLIDTGYSKETLEELVRVGTPVGFAPNYTELVGGKICGKGFDDKACVACAAYAIARTPAEELYGDVCLLLSNFEETSRDGGVTPAAFALAPDYAMCIDVNLGTVPDTKPSETVAIGAGPSITISTSTDRKLTRMLEQAAKNAQIPYQISVAPSFTGTNASSLQLAGNGVPTVDVGLPLAFMHTCCEIISVEDGEQLASLVSLFIKDESIGKEFGYEN